MATGLTAKGVQASHVNRLGHTPHEVCDLCSDSSNPRLRRVLKVAFDTEVQLAQQAAAEEDEAFAAQEQWAADLGVGNGHVHAEVEMNDIGQTPIEHVIDDYHDGQWFLEDQDESMLEEDWSSEQDSASDDADAAIEEDYQVDFNMGSYINA